jgi:predicted DCC family thiol-disulfide oxidoreductase YuxK
MAAANVLYDGECPLCLKSVGILKKLDWFHRLNYVNARDVDQDIIKELPVEPKRLIEEMHLVTPRKSIYHGFGAFRWMSWRLPLLWIFAPFMYLPGASWLGQKAYLWVARNRFKLVPCHGGVCTIQRKPTAAKST